MKLRSSTKIAIGFVVLAAVGYGGMRIMETQAIRGATFEPVIPGKVNLVGIDPGSGYRIVVANQMAQLVEGGGDFKSSDSSGGGPTDGAIKKRIPIKEMLGVLRGDSNSVGDLVMIMNDMRENDRWPTIHVVWTAENLRKAIAGDPAKKAQLERDLNMRLDGTPLPELRPSTLQNGIIIDFPVKLTVNLGGHIQEVVGRVQTPYRPSMIKQVADQLAEKQELTPEIMKGYYAEAAQNVLKSASREDIAKAIEGVISPGNAERLADAPERVLKSATVIVSDKNITSAKYDGYDTGDGKRFNLTIDLTDEGRRRLWRYSLDRVNSQILLIADGIAIAAPRIQHELSQGELTITRMSDEVLVRDATDMLNHVAMKAR